MSALTLVLLVLAAYRLARLVTRDSIWASTRDDYLEPWLRDSEHLAFRKAAELLTCPYCAGYWVAGVVAVYAAHTIVSLRWQTLLLVWWAVAGGQSLLAAADDRLNG